MHIYLFIYAGLLLALLYTGILQNPNISPLLKSAPFIALALHKWWRERKS
ncbi:hypothetical protein ACR6HW_09120 [Fusibacter sp. JL298sf-3]